MLLRMYSALGRRPRLQGLMVDLSGWRSGSQVKSATIEVQGRKNGLWLCQGTEERVVRAGWSGISAVRPDAASATPSFSRRLGLSSHRNGHVRSFEINESDLKIDT